ncbi:hypothetical protein K3495_g10227 [Podosphaera aphanis]|nr:hypothetical protein K3495_g10227 [Podosphaera aphanis]
MGSMALKPLSQIIPMHEINFSTFTNLRTKSIPAFLLPFKQKKTVRYNATIAESPKKNKTLSPKRKFYWVPSPTKFCPDVQTFLSLIGRNMIEHTSKFSGWSSLFRLESQQLKRLGLEPPRSRRYLLLWRERYRQGNLGIGADFKHVKDGVAQLQIAEVPKDPKVDKNGVTYVPPGMRKIVVNLPPGEKSIENIPREKLTPVKGFRVRGAHTIVGPYALPIKGGKGATVTRVPGMWEIRRGQKVDGGERRQAQVRAHRRAEEKRAAR